MNVVPLTTPKELIHELPLTKEQEVRIETFRNTVLSILQGEDPRILLIVGPCSIHNIDAAKEYASRLLHLADEVQDSFFVIMRTYFEKSRTANSWKGFLHDPYLDGTNDIETGIRKARKFLLELVQMGLPSAAEFVNPLAAHYIQDLISWGSVGARLSQSPLHRELAATLKMPVGFKNRTDGNTQIAIHAVTTAKEKHSFITTTTDGEIAVQHAKGNPFPHVVLRGGDDKENYNSQDIEEVLNLLRKAHLPPSIIVDCSHGNCKKNYTEQRHVFHSLIEQIEMGNSFIRGIMLESFLLESTQDDLKQKKPLPYTLEEIEYGASYTDPALDWNDTESLIRTHFRYLQQRKKQEGLLPKAQSPYHHQEIFAGRVS